MSNYNLLCDYWIYVICSKEQLEKGKTHDEVLYN